MNYRPHAYQACALTRLSYRPAIPIRYNLILRKRNEDGEDPAMFVRKLTIYIPRISKENNKSSSLRNFLRKEVIQPQVPLRLPCYDFTPVADRTVVKGISFALRCNQLPWCDGRCVQDPGTYSPRRADPRLLAIPASCTRVTEYNPN